MLFIYRAGQIGNGKGKGAQVIENSNEKYNDNDYFNNYFNRKVFCFRGQ